MSALALPGRGCKGARRRAVVAAFCDLIREIAPSLEFKVSSRGWAYILEEHGLDKANFDGAQNLLNNCRKDGSLPLDICADDEARAADGIETLDDDDPEDFARWIVDSIRHRHRWYTPTSFWQDQDYYIEALVEKIDLKSLFARDCERFYIPLTNGRGWSDLNSRAAMMRRFKKWEGRGKQCVLLYCGDHDPSGLVISRFIRSNMTDMANAVGWSPDNLIIDRFGLNADFIEEHGLTWIDGLSTGNANTPNLESPRHPDHGKTYVQDYLRRFGARKVEANALVVRPDAGRRLCREAFLRYLPEDAPGAYREALEPLRDQVRLEVIRLLAEEAAP